MRRIECAPEINQDNPHIRKILSVIGRVLLGTNDLRAFVTTESTVRDFRTFGCRRSTMQPACDEISKELGVITTPNSLIWELAAQMELVNRKDSHGEIFLPEDTTGSSSGPQE